MKRQLSYLLILLCAIVVLSQCAKIGSPTGGAKDITPPVFIGANPGNGATNVSAKKITLFFDEHVEVKKAETEVTISPPLKHEPQFITAPKKLIVTLKDTLLENSTYTISFGEGLMDLNEGNVLSDFEYVFSTGNQIDSLSYTGRVFDAFTLEPNKPSSSATTAYFMLHKGVNDSLPLKERPYYVSRIDDVGYFRINQIANGEYTPFVLFDSNKSFTFDKSDNEKIAFMNNPLLMDSSYYKVDLEPISKKERDSLLVIQKEPFEFDHVFLSFDDTKREQYLRTYTRLDSTRFALGFNMTVSERPQIRLLDSIDIAQPWFLEEPTTAEADSFVYWVADSTLTKSRRWYMEIKYMATDSLMNWVQKTDSLYFSLQVEQKSNQTSNSRRGRNEEPKIEKPKENPYPASTNWNERTDIYTQINISFKTPISVIDTSKIYIRQDSLETNLPFVLRRDSLSLKTVYVDWEKEFNKSYKLYVDSGAFQSYFGMCNDTLQVFNGSVRREEDYGNILANISNVQSNVIIQLFEENKTEWSMDFKIHNDTILNIPYLLTGKFILKAIHDNNGNGKWDTGDYLKKIQPEKVEFCPTILNVQSGFETQIDWPLKRTGPQDDSYLIIQSVRNPNREEIRKLKEKEEKQTNSNLPPNRR